MAWTWKDGIPVAAKGIGGAESVSFYETDFKKEIEKSKKEETNKKL